MNTLWQKRETKLDIVNNYCEHNVNEKFLKSFVGFQAKGLIIFENLSSIALLYFTQLNVYLESP